MLLRSAAIVAILINAAHAAPPPGANPTTPVAQWYRSLKQPGTGIGCCSEADCRPVVSRQTSTGTWEAMIKGVWRDVPPQVVIEGEQHPAGQAVACIIPLSIDQDLGLRWYCFVPPSAGG